MIISDRHKFVFIHIPKCAGLYIRSKLETYDDTDGAFSSRVEPHPELGVLDYVHIPLFTLRDYFPQEYAKVAEYWSFSVVRDPYKRFPSSLTQLFRMYADERIEEKSTREIRAKVDAHKDSSPNWRRTNPHRFPD